MGVVAVIPARGGSKSVPYKNLHPLGGKPLLVWPIETALATDSIDRVIVSTDDEKIAAAAQSHGAEIHWRPPELATDTALVIDTIRHLYRQLTERGTADDIMVLLEATAPFRTPELVGRCIDRMVAENLDSIATFNEASVNPERTWRLVDDMPVPFIEGAVPWKPRQLLTPAYQLNGAVYAFRPHLLPSDSPSILFGRMGAEVIPADELVDIDHQKDFIIADAILRSRTGA